MHNALIILAIAGTIGSASAQQATFEVLAAGPGTVPATSFSVNGGRTVDWQLSVQGPATGFGLVFVAADLEADASNPSAIAFNQGAAAAAFTPFEAPLGFSRLNIDGSSAFGGVVDPSATKGALREIGGAQNTTAIIATDTRFGQQLLPTISVAAGQSVGMATGSFLCPVIPGTYVVRVSRAAASHLRDLPSTQFAVRPVLLDPDFSTAQFTMTVYCPADVNRDGIYDSGDIGAFIDAFLAGDVVLADYLVDGILDLGDIGAFVDAFLLGCDGVPPPVIDDPIFQTFNEAQQELSAVPNQQIGTQTVSIGASLDLAEPFGTVTAVDLLTYMNRYLARDARANLDSNPDLDHEDIKLLRDALIEAIRLEAGGAP